MVSEGGGQGLVTLACLQDLSQARHRWPGQADGFPSLFGTTVVLPGHRRCADPGGAVRCWPGDAELVTRSVSSGRTLADHPVTDLLSRRPPADRRAAVDPLAPTVCHPTSSPGAAGSGAGLRRTQPAVLAPLAPAHRTEPWRSLGGPIGPRFRCTRDGCPAPSGPDVRRGRTSGAERRVPAPETHSGPRPDPSGPPTVRWSRPAARPPPHRSTSSGRYRPAGGDLVPQLPATTASGSQTERPGDQRPATRHPPVGPT